MATTKRGEWNEITETEFKAEVPQLHLVAGGDMVGGGSYAEFGDLLRWETGPDGNVKYFRFVWSK